VNFQQKIIIIIGIGSISFMLFFLSQSLYRSYLIDAQLNTFQQKNESIIEGIQNIQSEVEYFASERYQDKHAKEMLNKLQPGEKVIILSQKEENILIPQSSLLGEIKKIKLSTKEQWQQYFFGEDDLMMRIE
jgi:hypothetical protein